MSADPRTIETYAAKAGDYLRMTATTQPTASLQRFMALLPPSAKVLDIGCGPGTESALMRAAGLDPDPFDASAEMVALAQETYSLPARVASFDDITQQATYDGAWANFSLLHARWGDLPRHLHAIARALKPSGIFHIAMKTGEGEKRDTLGRFYTYISVTDLQSILHDTGLEPLHVDEDEGPGLAGKQEPFVTICARLQNDA